MPQPALFDGDVSALVGDLEPYESVLVELRNIETVNACVAYPYSNDDNDMRDFGYFQVGASGDTVGVEIGTSFYDDFGGWWRSPSDQDSPGPDYEERTCDNNENRCDDSRLMGQTFSSISGIMDYSYEVYRLNPLVQTDVVCSDLCTVRPGPDFCQ